MLKNDFVINPDIYLMPNYKISPFTNFDLKNNIKILKCDIENNNFENYINSVKNDEHQYLYTENAREGIFKALEALNLGLSDVVTILTTTGNFYISSCVTKEIEKICKWSREIVPETKVIFINHEFGWCHEQLEELKKLKLPIIEDCAHSFLSNNSSNSKGKIGDFIIYSLPKFFPIQIGGILVYNKKYKNIQESLDENRKKYIQKILDYYIDSKDIWAEKRIKNYKYLREKLKNIGIYERFELNYKSIPGVFMMKIDFEIDLNHLKNFLWRQGIECSVFYGEKSFFVPVHHNLEKEDLDYFVNAIEFFVLEGKNDC